MEEVILQNVPTWDEFIRMSPVVIVVAMAMAVGYVAHWWAAKAHIQSLKEFIEYLKAK